ncbi:MAG TPA: N-acetyltransferase [Actinomycetota bacterium]
MSDGGTIRGEEPGDAAAIADVLVDAFGGQAEARLVERLRTEHPDGYGPSLVAELDGAVVGHALLSRIGLAGRPDLGLLALAPVGVLPTCHGLGIGSALVRRALELATDPVVVVGEPSWYRRLGFEPAAPSGLVPPWPDVGDAWMVWFPEGVDGAPYRGQVVYPAPFAEV